jgi:hypothetical protein
MKGHYAMKKLFVTKSGLPRALLAIALFLLALGVSLAASAETGVPYRDASGVLRTTPAGTEVTVIDKDNKVVYLSGWYVVRGEVDYETLAIDPTGETVLILADGCKMSVHDVPVGVNHTMKTTFTVTGQSLDPAEAGTLSIRATGVGIRLTEGTYLQNGGNVDIAVTDPSGEGIFAGGGFWLNGGTLAISSPDNSINTNGELKITGGILEDSSPVGLFSDKGITLGWRYIEDKISIKRMNSFGTGRIKTAAGKTFTDGTNLYRGTLTAEQLAAINENGATLTPANAKYSYKSGIVPTTGDNASLLLWLCCLAGGSAGLLLLRRKRR